MVSSIDSLGSAAPVTRIACSTYVLPERGSRIAPPRQVAAPPNGSISVGWLCVSFLNMTVYFSGLPSSVTSMFMEQALISSDWSRLSNSPSFLSFLTAMVAMSMRQGYLSVLSAYSSANRSLYSFKASFMRGLSEDTSTLLILVANVVWRQ